MPRLASFLAVHASIDMILAILLSADELGKAAPQGRNDNPEPIVARYAEGTFGPRLDLVRRRGLLTPDSLDTAAEFNRLRNGFLHWKPWIRDRRFNSGHDVLFGLGILVWFQAYADLTNDPHVARAFGAGDGPRLPSLEQFVRDLGSTPIRLRL